MKLQKLALVIAAAGGLITQAAVPAFALGDGPAIASDWTDMDGSQNDCFARSEAAIQRMGFGTVEKTKYSRFGTKADYTVSVRCIEEKSLVLFLASGRDRSKANGFQLELQRNYVKGK